MSSTRHTEGRLHVVSLPAPSLFFSWLPSSNHRRSSIQAPYSRRTASRAGEPHEQTHSCAYMAWIRRVEVLDEPSRIDRLKRV